MFRLAMLALTALTLTSAGLHLWSEEASPPPSVTAPAREILPSKPLQDAAGEMTAALLEDAEMNRRMKTRRDFAAYTDQLLIKLVRGDLSLQQARENVLYYCLAHYPDYLHHIHVIEQGRSVREKLAHCLLRLVRGYYNAAPENVAHLPELAPEVLTNLEAEMEQMAIDDQESRPA